MSTKTLNLSLATAVAVLAAAAGCALPTHAAGRVEVRYVDADKFADIGIGALDRERALKGLTEYLQRLGQQLPDGQTLQVDVTDVDLAGSIEPWRLQSFRILRGRADWPRIDLHYALQQGGSTLKSGDAKLHDMAYLMSSPMPDAHDGDLPYEKRMLRKWFEATFSPPPAAAAKTP